MGLLIISFILACSSREEKIFKQAQEEIENKEYKLAVSNLEKITLTSPHSKIGKLAAKEGARVAFFY